MPVGELLTVLRRRWYAAFAVLIVGVGMVVVFQPKPLYWTQVDMAVLPPGARVSDLMSDTDQDKFVNFAAILEREFNDGQVEFRLAAADAPIYGAGIRQGASVELPNLGTQWQSSFSRAVLSVQVVDRSPERVKDVLDGILSRIEVLARNTQVAQGVAEENMITVGPVPHEPVVIDVGPSGASFARAALAFGTVGVVLACVAAVEVDRILARRRTRERVREVQDLELAD